MEKRENSEVVASSLAAVIRQSLNAPFRKECLLLLGVTNIRDATDKINVLLKSREIKKGINNKGIDMKTPVPVTFERGQQSLEQELEENPTGLTVPDSMSKSSLPDTRSKVETSVPLIIEATCVSDTQATDVPSDEEEQLDWEVETRGPK